MRMGDDLDLSILDGYSDDPLAARDQMLAELRGAAKFANAYLEGLENENLPAELIPTLLSEWHQSFWRMMHRQDVDPRGHGRPPHD